MFRSTCFVCIVAFFFSCLLTMLTIYHYPVFNVDGVLYLNSASVFLKQGIQAALQYYPWPLYYVLIAEVSHIIHFSLLHSAYFINMIFSAFSTIVFILIIKELKGKLKIQWIGALVFLVFITFNHYRADIIREHGYWLFYFLSILCLLHFSKSFSYQSAISWSISMFIATLFRIEGGVFLLLLPFFVIFYQARSIQKKISAIGKLSLLLFIGFCVYISILLVYPDISKHIGRTTQLIYEARHWWGNAIVQLQQKNRLLKEMILSYLGAADSSMFLVSGILGVYLFAVISTAYIGYVMLACFTAYKKMVPVSQNQYCVLISYVILNIIVTFIFYLQNFFISNRYLMPLALTLLIFVPFGLNYLYECWREFPRKWNLNNLLFWFVCLTIVWMAVGSLWRFGPSKVYIYKSAQWIRKNTPANAKVYTNHAVLGTLVERQSGGYDPAQADYFTTQKIAQKPWTGYNYAIFVMTNDDQKYIVKLEQTMTQLPIEAYYDNHHRDQAYIFIISEKN